MNLRAFPQNLQFDPTPYNCAKKNSVILIIYLQVTPSECPFLSSKCKHSSDIYYTRVTLVVAR